MTEGTPKPTHAELMQACDKLVELAAVMMVDGAGAPVPMMIDRMVTYAAAQMVAIDGKAKTASVLHQVAGKVEAGLFDALEFRRALH